MSRLFSIGITLLILISIGLLCGCVALYIIKENEIEKRILLEEQLGKVTKERDKIAAELEELKGEKSKIELELALKEKELQNFQEKFGSLKMEQSLFEGEKSTLVKELSSLRENFRNLEEDFRRLQQAKEILEEKLKDMMNSGIKLETIVVEPKATKERKTVKGEVLAVNKEYEFLVINLGLNNGIKENSEISIYKDSELVAIGKVEKLYENISAAVVNDKNQLRRVKVGDVAIATIEE